MEQIEFPFQIDDSYWSDETSSNEPLPAAGSANEILNAAPVNETGELLPWINLFVFLLQLISK